MKHIIFATVKEEQQAIDTAFVPSGRKFKIVCWRCERGPADGVGVKKIGWVWRCDEHPLPRRKL